MVEPRARQVPVGTMQRVVSLELWPSVLRGLSWTLMFVAGAAATLTWQAVYRQEPADNPQAGRPAAAQLKTDAEDAETAGRAELVNPPEKLPAVVAGPLAPVSTAAVLPPSSGSEPTPLRSPQAETLLVRGRTEPAPGRLARLPLATGQPVAFVDVRVGDRVEKGWQVFSHWESPERLQMVKTEVERAQKNSEAARMRYDAAAENARRFESLGAAVPTVRRDAAGTAAKLRKLELEAAELTWREAEQRFTATDFEFSQAFVTSPIAGIVTQVNVVPGDRRQAGAGFRGVEVLDASVLICRCLLSVEELAVLNSWAQPMASQASQPSPPRWEVEVMGQRQRWPAQVTSVGIQAEANSGLIPVLLEVANPDLKLLCNVDVDVEFRPPSLDSSPTVGNAAHSTFDKSSSYR